MYFCDINLFHKESGFYNVMNKYSFKDGQGYKVVIESETQEIADKIFKKLKWKQKKDQ